MSKWFERFLKIEIDEDGAVIRDPAYSRGADDLVPEIQEDGSAENGEIMEDKYDDSNEIELDALDYADEWKLE